MKFLNLLNKAKIGFSSCLLLTLSLAQVARADQDSSINECIKVRMALDIGSGSSKVRTGIVNACTQHLIAQITKVSVPIGFKDHLSSRPADDKNFTMEFMLQAKDQIVAAVAKAKAETAEKLAKDDKYKPYAYLVDSEIESAGVATEAFRQARNGVYFTWLLSKENIKIQIISQKEEGHLGFMGAMSALGAKSVTNVDPSQIISWDIGGGSLQIVGYQGQKTLNSDQTPWNDFGNRLASNPMRTFVVEQIKHQPAVGPDQKPVSPNPVVNPNLDLSGRALAQRELFAQSVSFAKDQLKDLLSAGWLQESKAQIFGIGGVHNGILAVLRAQKNHEKDTGYSQRDLTVLLDKLLAASDKDLVDHFGLKAEYTLGAVTNM